MSDVSFGISGWGKGALGTRALSGDENDYLQNLEEVSKFARGTRNEAEKSEGGAGRIGIFNGRVVKFATRAVDRAFVKTTEDMRDSCNELRKNLVQWSEKSLGSSKGSALKLDRIRNMLGIDESGQVKEGVGLLDRKVVASVLNMLEAAKVKAKAAPVRPSAPPQAEGPVDYLHMDINDARTAFAEKIMKMTFTVTDYKGESQLLSSVLGPTSLHELKKSMPNLMQKFDQLHSDWRTRPGDIEKLLDEVGSAVKQILGNKTTSTGEARRAELDRHFLELDLMRTSGKSADDKVELTGDTIQDKLVLHNNAEDKIRQVKTQLEDAKMLFKGVFGTYHTYNNQVKEGEIPSFDALLKKLEGAASRLDQSPAVLGGSNALEDLSNALTAVIDIDTAYTENGIVTKDENKKEALNGLMTALNAFQDEMNGCEEVVSRVKTLVNTHCLDLRTSAEMLNKLATLRLGDTAAAKSTIDCLMKLGNSKDIILTLDILNTMGHSVSPTLTSWFIGHLDDLVQPTGIPLQKPKEILQKLLPDATDADFDLARQGTAGLPIDRYYERLPEIVTARFCKGLSPDKQTSHVLARTQELLKGTYRLDEIRDLIGQNRLDDVKVSKADIDKAREIFVKQIDFELVSNKGTVSEITSVLGIKSGLEMKRALPTMSMMFDDICFEEGVGPSEAMDEFVTDVHDTIQHVIDTRHNPNVKTICTEVERHFLRYGVLLASEVDTEGNIAFVNEQIATTLSEPFAGREDIASKVRNLVAMHHQDKESVAGIVSSIWALQTGSTGNLDDLGKTLDILAKLDKAKDVVFALDVLNTMGYATSPTLTEAIVGHLDGLRQLDESQANEPAAILRVLLPNAESADYRAVPSARPLRERYDLLCQAMERRLNNAQTENKAVSAATKEVKVETAPVRPQEPPKTAEPVNVVGTHHEKPVEKFDSFDELTAQIREMTFKGQDGRVVHPRFEFYIENGLQKKNPTLASKYQDALNLKGADSELAKAKLMEEVRQAIQHAFDEKLDPDAETLSLEIERHFVRLDLVDSAGKDRDGNVTFADDKISRALASHFGRNGTVEAGIVDKVKQLVRKHGQGDAMRAADIVASVAVLQAGDGNGKTIGCLRLLESLLQLERTEDVAFTLDVLRTMGYSASPNLTDSIIQHLDGLRQFNESQLKKPAEILKALLPDANSYDYANAQTSSLGARYDKLCAVLAKRICRSLRPAYQNNAKVTSAVEHMLRGKYDSIDTIKKEAVKIPL